MAKGRELRGRIKSVEGTRKITRTMEMVATSKLKRAQDRVVPARLRRAAVLLLTSNRGLAGAFNANLIREARQLLTRLEGQGVEVDLHIVGRKGIGFFRYVGRRIATARTDITDRPTAEDAASLVGGMMDDFVAGRLDAVYVVY